LILENTVCSFFWKSSKLSISCRNFFVFMPFKAVFIAFRLSIVLSIPLSAFCVVASISRVILSTLSATFNTAFRFPALKKSRDFLSALRGSAFVNYFLDPTITATHKNAVTHTIVVQIIAIIFLFSFPRSLFCRLFL